MADDNPDSDSPAARVEKRTIADIVAYRPVVEALKAAGFKARLDVEHSFSSRSGSVGILLEPITPSQRAGLVELLRGSGLYLNSRSEIAKDFPAYARNNDNDKRNDLYKDKEVKGVVDVYTRPLADENGKPTGMYDAGISFAGLDLSFSPDLVPKGKQLDFQSGQVLANAIRTQAGKPVLPIIPTPEKMPTLAELEKAIPDLRTPPKPAEPADIAKALNRQFGPHGYNFKVDSGAIVSTRELDGKEKETLMSVVAAMPEAARLPLTAKYVNPNAPKDSQKFRLSIDPKRINQRQLDEFRRINQDYMDKLFDAERSTKPVEQSQRPPTLQESARSAVTFDVMDAGSQSLSLPAVLRQPIGRGNS